MQIDIVENGSRFKAIWHGVAATVLALLFSAIVGASVLFVLVLILGWIRRNDSGINFIGRYNGVCVRLCGTLAVSEFSNKFLRLRVPNKPSGVQFLASRRRFTIAIGLLPTIVLYRAEDAQFRNYRVR